MSNIPAAYRWLSNLSPLPRMVAEALRLIDGGLKLRTLRLPDIFQDHDKPEKQYAEAGLDAAGIVDTVLKALRHNSAGVVEGARA